MPYTALDEAWLEAGKPTRKEIFQRVKDNQDYFDGQIEALTQTSQVSMFNLNIDGDLSKYSTAQINAKLPVWAAPVAGNIVQIKMTLLEASTSGTLSLDVKRSVDGISFNTILTAPVDLTGTTVGSTSGTVSFISVDDQAFNQGDYISIELPSRQVGQGKFLIEIYCELSAGV